MVNEGEIKLKRLLSWEEIKPFARDLFYEYEFEIYWAQAAWDLLLENETKIGGIKSKNKKVESILYLLALYSLLFRFKWANGLESSDTEYEFGEKILDWGLEKEFEGILIDNYHEKAKKYEKFIKDYFNNDLGQINAFFDGDYYIRHYTNYNWKRKDDIEYDAEYDKYRCNMKREWLYISFLDNF